MKMGIETHLSGFTLGDWAHRCAVVRKQVRAVGVWRTTVDECQLVLRTPTDGFA